MLPTIIYFIQYFKFGFWQPCFEFRSWYSFSTICTFQNVIKLWSKQGLNDWYKWSARLTSQKIEFFLFLFVNVCIFWEFQSRKNRCCALLFTEKENSNVPRQMTETTVLTIALVLGQACTFSIITKHWQRKFFKKEKKIKKKNQKKKINWYVINIRTSVLFPTLKSAFQSLT